jgi:hypothetical protein
MRFSNSTETEFLPGSAEGIHIAAAALPDAVGQGPPLRA